VGQRLPVTRRDDFAPRTAPDLAPLIGEYRLVAWAISGAWENKSSVSQPFDRPPTAPYPIAFQ